MLHNCSNMQKQRQSKMREILLWVTHKYHHRYSACLGGCGEAASQAEGERRGPHTGETLPAKDGPAKPPVPSHTQLTASSAEAPGEGTARTWVCGCLVYMERAGRSRNHSQNTECRNQTGWVISLPKLNTKAPRKKERDGEKGEGRMGEMTIFLCQGVCRNRL